MAPGVTTSAKIFPNRLICEGETCTSGNLSVSPTLVSLFACKAVNAGFRSYSNCEVLKWLKDMRWWGFAYGKRVLFDILVLANVSSTHHKQVLEELEVLRGRLAVAAMLSFTQQGLQKQ